MDFINESKKNENHILKITQDKANKKATEHAIGIIEFIRWLFILNFDKAEILINDEHKLLIINGIRDGKKFIYRYFFFGCNEWDTSDENGWFIYKAEYIRQLKLELPKIKWNDDISLNVLAHVNKNEIVRK